MKNSGSKLLKKLCLLGICFFLAIICCNSVSAKTTSEKPNIIVVVVDDVHVTQVDTGLGKDDGYPYPIEQTKTPSLKELAEDGITMKQGYSANPMCWPSRGAIITGCYPRRWGDGTKIPLDIEWAPEYLQPLGYKSACIGKWHLRWDDKNVDQFKPLARGFDEFFGFLAGAHSYYLLSDESNEVGMKQGPIFKGHQPATQDDLLRTKAPYNDVYKGDPDDPDASPWYLTQELTAQTCDFIDRNHDDPFFVYLAYNARHTPSEVPGAFVQKMGGDPRQEYVDVKIKQAAMINVVDVGMKEITDALVRHGIKDDTMIIFVGDNGGAKNANRPGQPDQVFSGAKGSAYEGGKRVPYFVTWPNGLPAKTGEQLTYDYPVMHIDIVPTMLAAVGLEVPADLDGTNLLPYLRGEKDTDPHDSLHWNGTARKGNWKFFHDPKKGNKLFDLVSDPLEENNVVDEHPEVEKEMTALVLKYYEDTTGKR